MKKSKTPPGGLMTRDILIRLAGVHDMNCISIYVPTGRAGEKVDQKHAQIQLKNILQELSAKLKENGMTPREVNRKLSGAEELLDDIHFWRNQSDGLAIFIQGSDISYFTLPVGFELQYWLSDHFYLVPVIPFFNGNGTFYMLALGQQHVRLYQCTRDYISELTLPGSAPERLEDVVGRDFEEKSLQYRTGHGSDSGSRFHGQGAGKDDRDKEVENFIRAVDKAVVEKTGPNGIPLVLACDDQYFPIYRRVTGHRHLVGTPVSGNPDEADPYLLHEEAWLLVKNIFSRPRDEKKGQVRDLSSTGKSVYGVDDVVPAAVDGRIDTLFLQEGEDLMGIYNQEKRTVLPVERTRARPVSLFNMAAAHTLINGGEVYLEPAENMPFRETGINALLRY